MASAPSGPTPARAPGARTTLEDKDGTVFEIRPLRTDDREALQDFYERFEPKRAAQGLPPRGAERVARWLDTVLPSGVHLVVFRGRELVGHVLLMPTDREDTLEYAVFLRQDVRGRGLGTELHRLAIDTARAEGAARLWLTVEPHNRAAIRSYEKAGFDFCAGTVYSPEAEMQIAL